MPHTRPWPKKPEPEKPAPSVTERAWPSIRRALLGEEFPALRQVAFGVSEDQRQLHLWSTFDATADEDEREDLSGCLTEVYADFAWPERGDPVIHEHEVLLDRSLPLVARPHVVFERDDRPLLQVEFDAAGDPIGMVALVGGVPMPITGRRTTFGRKVPDCDLPIPNDSKVSRYHFVLELTAAGVQVVDDRSASGTSVDGERIDRSAWLRVGSVIVAGESEVRIVRRDRDGA